MIRHSLSTATGMFVLIGAICLLWACAGPQPLNSAIRPADRADYERLVPTVGTNARQAFLADKARQQGISLAQAQQQDLALPTDHNPFSARHDPSAVSRGAVLFQANCTKCHGTNADGAGTDLAQPVPELSFHDFGTRFAVTLHGGAPRKWFRIINEGADPLAVEWSDQPIVMHGYQEELAREQIWLLITYLQSIDADL